MSKKNKRIFEFGPFTIDTVNRQLMREDRVVPLKTKSVDTLLLLIENRGDVVEKDELMQALWPDSFVEEANLTQHIYSLRKALGEGDYIETIPRRGYRFVANVREFGNGTSDVIVVKETMRTSVSYEEVVEGAEAIEVPQNVIDLTPKSISGKVQSWSSRPWLWATLVFVALLIAALAIVPKIRNRSAKFESAKLTKLTTTGKAVKVAMSPDGSSLAYVFSDAGQQAVWVRQLATGKELPVVAAERTDIYGLTFSRDGKDLFYVSQPQNQLAVLYRVSTVDRRIDKLIEDVDSPVTLSPDGEQLAFIRFHPGNGSLVTANTNGTGERTLVTTRTVDAVRMGPNGVLPPSWSPDGQLIACPVSINGIQWDQAIYTYGVKDGSWKQLTANHWPAVGRIEWSPEGNGVFATITESYTSPEQQIWFIPYPEGAPRRVTNDLSDYRDFSVAANGNSVLTVQSEKKANIWLAPANDLDHPRQLTATSYDGLNGMSWTPDGRLVYTSQIVGEQNLWIVDPNRGEPQQLTAGAGFNETPVVSPDGRYIVFLSNRNAEEHLWRIDIDGRHPMELTHGTGDLQPTMTVDGKEVVFRSQSQSPVRLFRVSINGGEPVQLTSGGTFDPNVSPDGKSIACGYRPTPADKNRVAILSVDVGQPRIISDWPAMYGRLRWSPDGRAIAYAARQEGVGNIWLQPLDGSPPKQLTHWGANPIFSFDWSRDGKWLAYASGSITSDVVMISDMRR
jgi:Tol biopolymer transport system component/DNA-binding winged helix-turn-helix (wHTH) protein